MDNLLPLDLLKINKLFNDHHWDFKNDSYLKGVFDRFCKRFDYLDDDNQKKLILDLTKRYILINKEDYAQELRSLLNKVANNKLCSDKNIYLFPIDGYKIINKSTSGRTILELMERANIKQFCNSIFKKNVESIYTKDDLNNVDNGSILLLVDDIIGSGDTLNKCLKYLKCNIHIDNLKIIICSIAILKETMNIIQKEGFIVYSNIELRREISDYYQGTDLCKNIETMKNIEKKIQVPRKYCFGWRRTELLITLDRTPNDTFPYFWYYNMKERNAPFPRY